MKNEYMNSEMFIQSICDYEINWLDTIPNENEIVHEFSDTFKKKMDKLIKSVKKPYYVFINTIGKRAAVIILLVIISFSAITLNVKALRDPVINFVIEVYEKFSTMFFDTENKTGLPKEILIKYEPSIMPEGYIITEKLNNLNSNCLVYYNSNSNTSIMFSQTLIDTTELTLNTEETDAQYININEYIGIYYSYKEKQFIMWNNEEYSFVLYGNLSKEELINIANYVQKVE